MMTDPIEAPVEHLPNTGMEADRVFMRGDLLRLAQKGMELEAAEHVGVGRCESQDLPQRSPGAVCAGRVEKAPVPVPGIRYGIYSPSQLEPYRLSEKAIPAVVKQAFIEEVGTRRMETCCSRWD